MPTPWRVGFEAGDLVRDRHFRAELLRLGIGAGNQRHSGDPVWKTEVIFNTSDGAPA